MVQNNERLLRVEEVALTVSSSVKTVNMWYKWKIENADHEMAQLLPDFIQEGPRQIRYWKYSDVWKIIEFKNKLPHGCKGILGSVTQKYVRNK